MVLQFPALPLLLIFLLLSAVEEPPFEAAAAASAAAFKISVTLLPTLPLLCAFSVFVTLLLLPLKLLFVLLLLIVLLTLLQLLFAVWLLLLLLFMLLLLLLLLELDGSEEEDDGVEAAKDEDDVIVVNAATGPPTINVVDVGDAEPLRYIEDFKTFCLFLFNNCGAADKFNSESLSEFVCTAPALGTFLYNVEFRNCDDVVVDVVLWAGEEANEYAV